MEIQNILLLVLIYICVYSIVHRICKSVEFIAMIKGCANNEKLLEKIKDIK